MSELRALKSKQKISNKFSESRAAEIQTLSFSEILRSEQAVRFVTSSTRESYQDYFKGHEKDIGKMVERAWSLLVSSAEVNDDQLQQAVATINTEIFRKQDPSFWFNVMYNSYKTDIRPKKDFDKLQTFIRGKRILDYGSGGGYLALLLSKKGFAVSTTDVMDYRIDIAKNLTFRQMLSPTHIPYPDNSFDTVIVKAVLHHVDSVNLSGVLDELKRVSKRVIIEEDTYGVPKDFPNLEEIKKAQPALEKFMALRLEDQLKVLMLVDYFGNAIAQGIVEMNFPFQFKTVSQWQRLLESHGLDVTTTKLLGFQPGNVNKTCHVWLIADRK